MRTPKFAGLAAAAAIFATPAFAADLGPAQPATPAAVTAPFSWTGFYAGLNAGYAWIGNRLTVPGAAGGPAIADPDADGFSTGAQIGYRYQFAFGAVAGIEADGSLLWDAHSRSRYHNAFFGFFSNDGLSHPQWNASLRGTLGYAWGRWLPYVTGGIAFSEDNSCTTAFVGAPCAAGAGLDSGRTGWTVGGGLAYALTNRLVVNVEYRYADFGEKSYVTPAVVGFHTRSRLTTQKVMVGLSYKFGG